jgi:hypothetical protein
VRTRAHEERAADFGVSEGELGCAGRLRSAHELLFRGLLIFMQKQTVWGRRIDTRTEQLPLFCGHHDSIYNQPMSFRLRGLYLVVGNN